MIEIERANVNPVINTISLVYHNIRHNLFHSPIYKNADDEDYFQIVTDEETELIFKSDLKFMCVYKIHAEIYSFRDDDKNFLLVRKDPWTGEFICEWITTDRIAHDVTYMKITNRTFTTFVGKLYELRTRLLREQKKYQNFNFDLHREPYWQGQGNR